MSPKYIAHMNKNQLFSVQCDIVNDLIKKTQREYDNKIYPVKSRYDKLQCLVCGGAYTRQCKSKHDSTKKHLREINNIHNQIANLF